MNVRRRINLFALLVLAALSSALIVTSYVVINRIIVQLNSVSFSRELANIDFNIRQSHQELESAGLLDLEQYVTAEKERLLDLMRGYKFGETGQLIVLNSRGTTLLPPSLPSGHPFLSKLADITSNEKTGAISYSQDGETYFAMYQRSSHWDWLLVMSITKDELFKTQEFYVRISLLVSAAALLVVGGFSFALWRGIGSRISETLAGLRGIEEGRLDTRLPVLSQDEIGVVQEGINRMTERLQGMIAELSENRAKYLDLYDNSPDCLMSVDTETGRIVECNARLLETLGAPRKEVIGRELLYMYDEASRERALEASETLKEDGEVHGVELRVRRNDGTTLDVLFEAIGFYDAEGRLQYSRSSWTDISQRIEFEQTLQEANQKLQELDRMKSMFIASVSHELRTPLNSVIGFSGSMLQGLSGELNAEQRDGLERVNRAGKHLLTLISDIIDISRIESGQVKSVSQDFLLEEVVAEAIDHVGPELKDKGLAIRLDVPTWPKMHSDRSRLLQCLTNYLSNAVKFTESGTVTVSVRDEPNRVHIAVEDTGIGIAEEDIGKLFEAFERLDSKLRVKAGGTGLGLYLVKKIATDVLAGSVSVESRLGEGSVFGLNIAKHLEDPEPEAERPGGG